MNTRSRAEGVSSPRLAVAGLTIGLMTALLGPALGMASRTPQVTELGPGEGFLFVLGGPHAPTLTRYRTQGPNLLFEDQIVYLTTFGTYGLGIDADVRGNLYGNYHRRQRTCVGAADVDLCHW